MLINADFGKRVVVHAGRADWTPSPVRGVERKMLDRVGGEVARATSIVRYAPGSSFPPHTHDGGEEFLVLDGVFQDEFGDYPSGSYVRNPPTSRHTPRSEPGCIIFVKLYQFDPSDRTHIRIASNEAIAPGWARRGDATVMPLYDDGMESVRIERWSPAATVSFDATFGLEALVLEGSFDESGSRLTRHSWLRLPQGSVFEATAGRRGATVWIKTGHLRVIRGPV